MPISREEAENWLFNGCCPCFDVNDHFCAKHKGEIIELLRQPKLTVERVKGMIEEAKVHGCNLCGDSALKYLIEEINEADNDTRTEA